jgi:predicted ATPase
MSYHPDYGMTDDYRKIVLRDADLYGVPTAAAKHNLAKQTIYRWRSEMEREKIENESWIDICARHLTMENTVVVLCVFVGIVALSHAVTFYLGR